MRVFLSLFVIVSILSDTTALMLNDIPYSWRFKALYQYLIIFLNLLVQIITLYSSFQSTYIITI